MQGDAAMTVLPFVMLACAFAMLLFSTRQMHLLWRLAALTASAALIIFVAMWNGSSTESMGLISTVTRHPDLLAAAIHGNWPTIEQFAAPALDLLVIFAVLLLIGCALALLPGEAMERIIRPINIGLIGAIIGGVAVLLVSAIGFGAVSKRQVFIASVPAEDTIDGDTIRIGEVSLRLWGVDAPEDDQICLRADRSPFDCGALAKDALIKFALPGPIFCRAPAGTAADIRLQESFGRPLVSCSSDQQGYGQLPDIARELVAEGYAYPYEARDGEIVSAYVEELNSAIQQNAGFHNGVFLKPTQWRNDPHARCHVVSMAQDVAENEPDRDRLEARLKRLREACGLVD